MQSGIKKGMLNLRAEEERESADRADIRCFETKVNETRDGNRECLENASSFFV